MDPFQTILYEVSEGADTGAAPDTGAAGDEGAAGAESTATEDTWSGPSQEEWQAAQEGLQRLQQLEQELYSDDGEGEEEGPQIELDPFADNFGEQLVGVMQQVLAQSPYGQFQHQQMMSEASEREQDIIADHEARDGEFLFKGEKAGEFDSRALVHSLAESYLPEEAAKSGFGAQAAEAAIARAVKQVRAAEEAIGKAYYQRQMNQMHTLSGAQRNVQQPGGQGAEQLTGAEGGDEFSVVSKYLGGGLA